jgi:hypothetical protein
VNRYRIVIVKSAAKQLENISFPYKKKIIKLIAFFTKQNFIFFPKPASVHPV